MSSHKAERLIDLIAFLLSSKIPVTRARIKKLRTEYQTAGEATFDRMFARDKKELLSIGVPVKVYNLEEEVMTKTEDYIYHVYRAYPSVPSPFYTQIY